MIVPCGYMILHDLQAMFRRLLKRNKRTEIVDVPGSVA